MERKLILTPTDVAYLYGFQDGLKDSPLYNKSIPIDIPHCFLSIITMSGVDCIQSMIPLKDTDTTLIKKLVKKPSVTDWFNSLKQISEIFNMYKSPKMSKPKKRDLFLYENTTTQLLFAMKSKSSVLIISDPKKSKYKSHLPPELTIPFEFLFTSIQSKDAQLPIIQYDTPKKDIRKLLDILSSNEFRAYKEAQSEIENKKTLTSKTINLIEKAGKDLYHKNKKYVALKESVVKALPLSSKVIELFFGKLPGVLAESASKIIVDYLRLHNTIPIYNAESISSLLKDKIEIQSSK